MTLRPVATQGGGERISLACRRASSLQSSGRESLQSVSQQSFKPHSRGRGGRRNGTHSAIWMWAWDAPSTTTAQSRQQTCGGVPPRTRTPGHPLFYLSFTPAHSNDWKYETWIPVRCLKGVGWVWTRPVSRTAARPSTPRPGPEGTGFAHEKDKKMARASAGEEREKEREKEIEEQAAGRNGRDQKSRPS